MFYEQYSHCSLCILCWMLGYDYMWYLWFVIKEDITRCKHGSHTRTHTHTGVSRLRSLAGQTEQCLLQPVINCQDFHIQSPELCNRRDINLHPEGRNHCSFWLWSDRGQLRRRWGATRVKAHAQIILVLLVAQACLSRSRFNKELSHMSLYLLCLSKHCKTSFLFHHRKWETNATFGNPFWCSTTIYGWMTSSIHVYIPKPYNS